MALLHIFDASDKRIKQTVKARGSVNQLPIKSAYKLRDALDRLVLANKSYTRILFETHGSAGKIWFGGAYISAGYWRLLKNRYNSLACPNVRIYFNGCNVAEGKSGWRFLEAAAGAFMNTGGGTIFGQTSVGFGNPFNGHVVHLWGKTRTLFVNSRGRIIERFEQ